jgi:exosortase A-associated hydrolase 1
MGDSAGRPSTFETIGLDIDAAIIEFRRQIPDLEEIVLWGLCDAASAAMMFGAQSHHVKGIVALNPWVRNDTTLAKSIVKHYYPRRLVQRDFWAKFLAGRVRVRDTLLSVVADLRQAQLGGAKPEADFITRMRHGLMAFPGRTLIILSGNDLVAKEFIEVATMDPRWKLALANSRIERVEIPDADHTFSNAQSRLAVEQCTLSWLASWPLAAP